MIHRMSLKYSIKLHWRFCLKGFSNNKYWNDFFFSLEYNYLIILF